MTLNVALNVSRQPEWLHALRRAGDELGWRAAYWITYEENHDEVATAFPEAQLHRRLDLNRGILPKELEDRQFPALSAGDLERAAPYVLLALEIFNRFDLDHSMGVPERLRLVHRLMAHWRGVIHEFNIDLAVFSAPPHAIGNYLLYAMMRMLSKQVMIFKSTSLLNINFITDDIDSTSHTLLKKYEEILRSPERVGPSAEVASAMQQIREASSSFKPWYLIASAERHGRKQGVTDQIEGRLDLVVPERFLPAQPIKTPSGELLRKRRPEEKGGRQLDRTFKLPGRPLSDSRITLQEHEDYRDWAYVQKKRLQEEYAAVCSPVEGDSPFVYLAFHYQPERTTNPEGRFFSSHYLCASLLAEGIPEGWRIVMKEHPSQFLYTGMGELGRWKGYYHDFKAIQRAAFVPIETSTIDLIDRSQAVVTISGAVGWEALVRGRPVLHFGAAWYEGCRGAYRVRDRADVEAACRDASQGRLPTERDVAAFATALESIGRPVYTTPSQSSAIEFEDSMSDMFFDLMSMSAP